MDQEDIEDNKFLQQLIAKRQIMASNNTNQSLEDSDYSEFSRKKLEIKNIYKEKKESYQPQESYSIGPARPEVLKEGSDSDSDSESVDSFVEKCKDVDFGELNLPFTHQTSFSEHKKTISAITLDRAACRMVTSSADNCIKYWDFANMSQSRKSFRHLEPRAGQPPKHIAFNGNGSLLLVTGGNARPRMLNRDGRLEFKFIKGDMYISDLKHTRGHIGVVTGGEWHPFEPTTVVTSSLDSTIRLWDISAKRIGIENLLPAKVVIRCRNQKGTNAPVWKSKLSHDGGMILASCQDGSYQVFTKKNRYTRPEMVCRTPYKNEITDLQWFRDGSRFLSRGQDNTMRLFDIRNFTRPVYTWYELENNHESTEIAISPDQKFAVTGTSNTRQRPSCLAFFDMESMNEITRVPISETGKVTCVQWNEKLNQIFIGAGSDIIGYYNPKVSKDGAMLCVGKTKRQWQPEDYKYARPVLTPHALPLFNKDHTHRRKNMEKIRMNEPKLSMKPELPHHGPGKNGKLAGAATITQHLMRNVHRVHEDRREDPIKALFRYQKEAEENPEFVDHAYKYTQPVKILDYTSEKPDEQKLMSKFRKCPKCGLKVCHCYKVKV